MSERHGKLKVGSIETNVSFVGGTASPSGSQPAYMTTKDPIAQFVIENSREFKSGFIILLLTQEVAGVHPRMAVPKAAVNENENQNGSQPNTAVSGVAAAPATEPAEKPQETVEETGENQGGEDADAVADGGEDGAGDGTAVQTVEVADKKDAIEWLKEKYPEKGYNGNNLRSAAAFETACQECGVEFVFTA